MSIDLDRIRAQTPGIDKSVHLLASGSALMPQPVVDAIINHTLLEAEIGGYEAEARQSASQNLIYDHIASHINAKANEIAVLEHATAAWMHAFYALDLPRGSRILTCQSEYAANYVAFLQRAKKDDLSIEVVPNDPSGALDPDALASMIDDNVSLIAMTWVPTNGGLVNPAAAVGKIAKKHNIPYLLDACQALGQMKIDVEELGCDFLSTTGRKFLRGPRGIGFLYVHEKWLTPDFEPAMIDFFGAPWVAPGKYELRTDARRFETWENSYALRAGLDAAILYADEVGIDAIEARVRHMGDYTRKSLGALDRVQLRDLGTQKCGIVSFTVDGMDSHILVSKMYQAGFAIGASGAGTTLLDATARNLPELTRMVPHYYNTEQEIDRAVETLAGLIE